MIDVRRLGVEDAGLLVELRKQALDNEPLAFGASPQDDVASRLDAASKLLAATDTQSAFGYVAADRLAGAVGVFRPAKIKQAHTAIVWGMYVTPGHRGKGVGAALLGAAIQQARQWGVDQLQLTVSDAAPAAKRLYERMGFKCWGREPRALKWLDRYADEYHLVLDLIPVKKAG